MHGPAKLLRLAESATFRTRDGIAKVVPGGRRSAGEVRAEADLVAQLGAAGAPVPPLVCPPLDAGGEGAVILLAEVPDDARRDGAAYAAMGESLAAFHAAGRELLQAGAVDVPRWKPLDWLDKRLDRVRDGLDPELAETLRAGARAAAEGLNGKQTLLHTDAHAGNFRVGKRTGAVLVDLEQVHRGPWRYDLAPMEVGERRYGGKPRRWRMAVQAYGADPHDPDIRRCCTLREHLAIGWLAARAVDDPALLDEARRRLEDLVEGRDAEWVAR